MSPNSSKFSKFSGNKNCLVVLNINRFLEGKTNFLIGDYFENLIPEGHTWSFGWWNRRIRRSPFQSHRFQPMSFASKGEILNGFFFSHSDWFWARISKNFAIRQTGSGNNLQAFSDIRVFLQYSRQLTLYERRLR